MNEQSFHLIVKMIETNKEDSDKRFENIDKKLDEILEFRYKLLGGAIVISAIAGILVNMFLNFMSRG